MCLFGYTLTPRMATSQIIDEPISIKTHKEKFVKKNYEKTYKAAQKHLDKQVQSTKKSGGLIKEVTPLGWWKQEYLMTMDPELGRPTPEVLMPIVSKLNGHPVAKRATPGTKNHPWISRGPNHISGRTRALMWDPNDSKQLRLFAGGVTGGLWVNQDISDSTVEWKMVNGIWPNLNITCIAYDPNDPKIMYVGTGEGFGTTASSSRGLGIFKSTDGGLNWSHLSNTETMYYINDIIVRNESGTSVLYVAADFLFYQGSWHGNSNTVGLLRSTNGGSSFTNVSPNITSQTHKYVVSDLEIDASNRLWLGTRKNMYSTASDQGGGRILYTDNGTAFTEVYKNNNALKGRVELACAPSSKDTLYAVIEANSQAQNVVRSFNNGSTWSNITEPNDADQGIPETDFTRNQAWYDLILAVNPVDASEVIIGGINFFMSKEAGSNWRQISKWSENANMNQLSCSYVHADMHAAIYSNDGRRLAVGTDGGVFYAPDIRNNPWNSNKAFLERNNQYIVTQYYAGSISQISPNFMLAGAQDNGTSYTLDTGLNIRRMLFGGDGGYCFIHPEDDNALVFSYIKNNFYGYVNFQFYNLMQDNTTGSFINPAGLDFVNNNLFSQKNARTIYRNSITGSTSSLETLTFVGSGSDLASAFHVIKRKSTGNARLFIGTHLGRVFYTDNPNAASPTFNALGTVNQGNISSIKSLDGSEDTLILTLTNYGINNVYLSTNAGVNWTAIDGDLPNMPVWDVVFNPLNRKEAIIATEIGMYQCLDVYSANPKWEAIQEGMGPVKTMMMDYNRKEGVLMATTHGRGLFTSNAWTKTDPIAYFNLKDDTVCSKTKVTLIDSSINQPSTRKWEINTTEFKYIDGSNQTSEKAYVEFSNTGKYQIKLTVEKEGVTSEIIQEIHVFNTVDGSFNLAINPINYCGNDTLNLNVNFQDATAGSLTGANTRWFKNGMEMTDNLNKLNYKIIPPLNNGDEYKVEFEADYVCLFPKKSTSNIISINSNESVSLTISRDWDTLFSNYTGPGVVEWFRNNFKIAIGTKYVLIQNGNFHARVVLGTCIGANSNTIEYKELNKEVLQDQVDIFPNPSTGFIFIRGPKQQVYFYEIRSIEGRLVQKGDTIESSEIKLSDGQYIVTFMGKDGQRIHKKVTVSNSSK